MIDRYQLRYFLAVVDTGNFSRAAARTNVTQPTLSIGIAKLEQALNAKLFLRNSQRVQLTDAGARLLESARRIEHEFNLAERPAGAAAQPRRVRLGVLTTIPTERIERLVRRHGTAASPDQLEVIEGNERELLARLDRGRVDVALTLVRGAGTRYLAEPLYEEGYALAVSISHPLAQREAVSAEALATEVMIVRRQCEVLAETSRYFTERGVRPAFSFRSLNDDKVLAMVRAGLGITVMPDSYADPGVARPKLLGFEFKRQIGLVYADHVQALKGADSSVIASARQLAMN